MVDGVPAIQCWIRWRRAPASRISTCVWRSADPRSARVAQGSNGRAVAPGQRVWLYCATVPAPMPLACTRTRWGHLRQRPIWNRIYIEPVSMLFGKSMFWRPAATRPMPASRFQSRMGISWPACLAKWQKITSICAARNELAVARCQPAARQDTLTSRVRFQADW